MLVQVGTRQVGTKRDEGSCGSARATLRYYVHQCKVNYRRKSDHLKNAIKWFTILFSINTGCLCIELIRRSLVDQKYAQKPEKLPGSPCLLQHIDINQPHFQAEEAGEMIYKDPLAVYPK